MYAAAGACPSRGLALTATLALLGSEIGAEALFSSQPLMCHPCSRWIYPTAHQWKTTGFGNPPATSSPHDSTRHCPWFDHIGGSTHHLLPRHRLDSGFGQVHEMEKKELYYISRDIQLLILRWTSFSAPTDVVASCAYSTCSAAWKCCCRLASSSIESPVSATVDTVSMFVRSDDARANGGGDAGEGGGRGWEELMHHAPDLQCRGRARQEARDEVALGRHRCCRVTFVAGNLDLPGTPHSAPASSRPTCPSVFTQTHATAHTAATSSARTTPPHENKMTPTPFALPLAQTPIPSRTAAWTQPASARVLVEVSTRGGTKLAEEGSLGSPTHHRVSITSWMEHPNTHMYHDVVLFCGAPPHIGTRVAEKAVAEKAGGVVCKEGHGGREGDVAGGGWEETKDAQTSTRIVWASA
ncbi:hypothetical protein B0H14DRAFT_2563043 [Mycena olivaceomarginata]|nr:hypothetical protein B0H14DRAFT_2563043 [Mycena olivaceomarginata]